MTALLTLAQLGPRICIIGPSNSGKSTLATAIGQKNHCPVIHLDQLYHQPHSNWVPRPTADFLALHDAAIAEESWIMEGNYSVSMPQRLARATGLIVLELSTALSLMRYLRRSLYESGHIGSLEGGQGSIKWNMIKHIAIITPKNRKRYHALYQTWSGPKVRLDGARALQTAYREWALTRPTA
ncbi:AAA family ATPase [Paenalcaligenes suwonensis]|uniref:AAA family ATPase n=1 Tax=Paenalcaligenes suwonensis TaxID=1202713 RepID=UPI001A984C4C|nr:AAA family ATPase [Paenalcaligenes suwonensis]